MNDVEIDRMAALEDSHWWYVGLRDLIGQTLRHARFALPRQARVLDAGCGTGATLRSLQRNLAPAYLGGFDSSPRAVSAAQDKASGADVYQADLRHPALHQDSLDLVLCCDVLSIAGIDACWAGMQRLVAALRRGGLLLLHLPAYGWLRSSHDRAIGTRDRTTVLELDRLLRAWRLKVELLSYRLCLLFPAVLAARLPSMLRPRPDDARTDLVATAPHWNRLLAGVLRVENGAIVHGASLPWGSSVYAVARKL